MNLETDAEEDGMLPPLPSGIQVDTANAAELAAAGCPAAAERPAPTGAAPPVTATPNDRTAHTLEAEQAVLGKVSDGGPSDTGPAGSGSAADGPGELVRGLGAPKPRPKKGLKETRGHSPHSGCWPTGQDPSAVDVGSPT